MMVTRLLDRVIFAAVDAYVALKYWQEIKTLRRRTIGQGGETCSVAAPRCTNSKYVWRKLFDHDPRFTVLADKLAVREFVDGLGIDANLPNVLWQGELKDFPETFYRADVIIKSNHGWSTHLLPVRDNLTRDEIDDGLARAIGQDHGRRTNEWAYYDIKPKLFVEEIVSGQDRLIDLKVHCFGEVITRVVPNKNRADGKRVRTHWMVGKNGEYTNRDEAENSDEDIVELPESTDEALRIAREISGYFDHVRVDFLAVDQHLFLGEVTIYSLSGTEAGGHATDTPSNMHWDLRRSWFLNTPHRGWRAVYARALQRFCEEQAQLLPSLDKSGTFSREKFDKSLKLAQSLLAKNSL